ncbi:hypothetical protein JCM16138_06490 [Thermococcus atlanticus]
MKIRIIKPLHSHELSKEGYTGEIYYPFWIYVFSYRVKRKIFGDIKGMIVVMVDGINGKGYLADIVPDFEEINCDKKNSRILKPCVKEDESLKIATEKAESFLFRKYAYLKFTYELKYQTFTYKLFWAKKENNRRYILKDSITGEEIEIVSINGER